MAIKEIKDKKDYRTSKATLRQYKGQSRAFLKVQDGCDGYCTYCIVPKIRNVLSNKPIDEVVKETSALIYAGHKEIVLTGIFLGAWGRQTVRRKKWDSETNCMIALESLKGKPVSETYTEHNLSQSQHYKWGALHTSKIISESDTIILIYWYF